MRLVVAGTPEVALPTLDALHASDHEVIAVLTRPDAPTGRGRRLRPSPMAGRAAELGIEVLTPNRPRDEDFISRLTELAPDCVPIVAYGALIPAEVIALAPHGWVNLHFSLLPRWRGAAPVQRAVLAGDTETGAVTFSLVPELDAGPIYRTLRTPIGAEETAGDLLTRLAEVGAGLMVETMDDIAAGVQPTPQPDEGITTAAKLDVTGAQIDWQAPSDRVDRHIRGHSPAPGAWTTMPEDLGGERLKVLRCRRTEGSGAPGEVTITKRAVTVACGTGAVELVEVQAHGKKPMRAVDWARGLRVEGPWTLGR
ncbi:methionyl-tRNA formyltransferase [Enemella sp. A6]|uniref:methionyl-tRNA formyltransferase n=1 Tax=Enemella sp. A6 TaxID=3440152 RepID=UPI003EBBA4C7